MIDFENVGFTYDGDTFVLDGADLHVDPGAFVCVLGGNGSGKSTLAKHINVLLVPDRGRVRVLGRDTADPANTYFIRSNAGMVFQNPDDQIVASLIENDVAFGPENLGVPADQLRQRVTEALEKVGLQGFEKSETTALSGGQKQRVAIAGALAMQPQILVLDEATAMLDPRGRSGLLRVCRELNEDGMTIVMITHFMEEAALADCVFVLAGGKVALSGAPQDVLVQDSVLEGLSLDVPFATKMARALQQRGLPVPTTISEEELVASIVTLFGGRAQTSTAGHTATAATAATTAPDGWGAVAAARAPQESKPPAPAEADGRPGGDVAIAPTATPLIVLEGVSYSYDPATASKANTQDNTSAADWGNTPTDLWALRDVSLTIEKGRFTGIAGHTGSGKSTLIQHMNGLLAPTHGRVLVNGIDIADKTAAHAARQNVGLVFQYPEHQLFAAIVYEDVAFGPRNMGLAEEDVDQRVRDALALVELDFDTVAQRSPFELSGGQQRRVAFAGVLAMQPETLILDEPVAGLDPEAREDFLRLIERLHAEGNLTVVLVSHSMDDLARLCDTVVLMNQGSVFAQGAPADVLADAETLKSIGLDIPAAHKLAVALAHAGVDAARPQRGTLASIESLAEALASAYAQR